MPLFFWDSSMILLIPALLFGIWAQWKVKSTFKRYSKIPSNSGMTGYEVAKNLLERNNIFDVEVEEVAGSLTDHYDSKEKKVRLSELLSNVGLSNRLFHKPSELSGGERQRVAVARSLMNEPKLILADEPAGNLDSGNAESLYELMWMLKEKREQSFVIVTHNEELARRADRTIRMEDGLIVS